MHSKFHITIRTPEQEVVSREAESLYVTTETGDLMFLPEHAAFSGVISFGPVIIADGDHEESYVVRRGIVSFSNNRNEATISCLQCDTKESLDFNSMKDYLALIEEKLKSGEGADLSDFQIKFLENERLALVQQLEE